jgi:hypothetical protein
VGRQNTGNSSVAGNEQATRILRIAEGQTEELQTSMTSEGPPSAAGCPTGEDQRRSVIDSLRRHGNTLPAPLPGAVWHTAQVSLRTFLLLAMSFALATSLFLPGRGHAQKASPLLSDVDSGKVQPLDLKPGCWQVRTRVVAQGLYTQMALRQVREIQKVDNLTPEQRAQMIAGFEATAESAEESAKQVQNLLQPTIEATHSMCCATWPYFGSPAFL